MLCVTLRAASNAPVHSTGVINYAIAVRLFRTVLRDHLNNFSRYNSSDGGTMKSREFTFPMHATYSTH